MVGEGIVYAEEVAEKPRQQRHHRAAAQHRGQQHGKIERHRAVEQRLKQVHRHQHRRGGQPRNEKAEGDDGAGEKKTEEVRGDGLKHAEAQAKEDGEHQRKAQRQGKIGGGIAALLAAIAPEGGQRAEDQTEKQADRNRLRAVKQREKPSGAAEKANGGTQCKGQEQLPVLPQRAPGMGEHLHHRAVHAEEHCQQRAGHARQDAAHADQEALPQTQSKIPGKQLGHQ